MLVKITTIESVDTKNLISIDDIILSVSKYVMEAPKDCKDVEKSKFRLDYRNHLKESGLHFLQKTLYRNFIVQVIAPSSISNS